MTLQELFDTMAANPTPVLLFFTMLPVTAVVTGFMTDKGEAYESPWKYLYSALIYLACLPGIFALTMCVYHLLIDGRSFLQLNVLAYFLPILVMIGTLLAINRTVDMRRIPGFNRISGLSMIIVTCFITILIIQKTRIWIFIGGSMMHLFGLFVILFFVFSWGMSSLFKSPEPVGTESRGSSRKFDIEEEDDFWS